MQKEIFEFNQKAKTRLGIVFLVGVGLLLLGFLTRNLGKHEAGAEGHGDEHAVVVEQDSGVAHTVSLQEDAHQEGAHEGDNHHEDDATHAESDDHHDEGSAHADDHHSDSHAEEHHGDGGHTAATGHDEGDDHGEGHAEASWSKRLGVDLWINHIYWFGIAIVGLFFFAIQYAAQAGWSAQVKRVAFAFGGWLPIAFVVGVVLFFVFGHDIFHWTHSDLYTKGDDHFDEIINGKAGFFYYPLSKGGLGAVFFLVRMVIFFGVWVLIMRKMRSLNQQEDKLGGDDWFFKLRKWSAIFLVFFAVTSSVSAWDWVLSIDTHWFSTMFGWYVFASWFVTGLAATTLVVVFLREAGYLPNVTADHLHDLGKFMFAFSIFWTYVWFSQFLLIYYANIPEETIYYVERLRNDHFAPFFFVNLIMNFILPFLVLMTRDAKRHTMFLKVVSVLIMAGHWLDFYLMMTPGTVGESGAIGFTELGTTMIFGAAFIFVALRTLTKLPLVGKNDPMVVESMHHHT